MKAYRNLFTLIIILANLKSFGQNNSTKDNTILSISTIFASASPKLSNDSVAMYAYNFTLHVQKAKSGSKLVSITTNDSLAYIIFPMYKNCYRLTTLL
jgi:predicted ATPase